MKKEPVFTGVCTAIVTPFGPDGAISYDVFERLIAEQIARGVDAICVCGTTGESATMSAQEHDEAVSFCVRQANGRVKVIAGAGSNDTAAALSLSRRAQEAGADALLHVTPYYNKATQAGLIRHYEYIADRVDLPILLYHVPGRTGVSFTAETYRILSQHPNINGVKEASGDLSLAARTISLCGDALFVWSGNDDQTVPLMALGARGVVSVASNLIPEVMTSMTHLCLEGRFEEAARLQLAHTALFDALFLEVNPIPIKAAMEMAGYPMGGLRLPLCDISAAHRAQLRTVMEESGLLLRSA